MPLPTNNGNGKKHHPALPWQDVPSFMSDLGQRHCISARALEFLTLTAARTGEVIGATWDEIDLDERLWVVPAECMKATREHCVPLSADAVALLEALPREQGNKHVFLGGKAGGGLSNTAMLQLIRDMRPGYVPHGMRASFKTWCDDTQHVENAVVEAALAHISGDKVERAYRRSTMIAKRAKLMTDWARYCRSTPAEVADLAEKRDHPAPDQRHRHRNPQRLV